MDDAERTAEAYLKHAGFGQVVYEPDGNVPPDFLCDQQVAVEVRRLNQQEMAISGNSRGLEETAIPLLQRIRNLLIDLGSAKDTHSWFIYFRFSRPIPSWRVLGPMLRVGLEKFRDASTRERTSLRIHRRFDLEIFQASRVIDNQFFILGGYTDHNSGGWLLAEMQSSLSLCISEKTRKIARVRNKYPEWWLVLVDHIGYGLDDFDRELFRDQVKVEHTWDKVILIDPRDARHAFEV